MLTVRHIHLNGGEDIILVYSVRFAPGYGGEGQRAQMSNEPSAPDTLWINIVVGQSEEPLTGGTVFVMNDMGKTVARYYLGASPVPLYEFNATAYPPGMKPSPAQ